MDFRNIITMGNEALQLSGYENNFSGCLGCSEYSRKFTVVFKHGGKMDIPYVIDNRYADNHVKDEQSGELVTIGEFINFYEIDFDNIDFIEERHVSESSFNGDDDRWVDKIYLKEIDFDKIRRQVRDAVNKTSDKSALLKIATLLRVQI